MVSGRWMRVVPNPPTLHVHLTQSGLGTSRPQCVCEGLKLTGESPSPAQAWEAGYPKATASVATQGGELPEEKDPSRKAERQRLELDTAKQNDEPAGNWRSRQPGVASGPSANHVKGGGRKSVGWVEREGLERFRRQAERSALVLMREQRGSQSLHSSDEAGNDRGAKGGRQRK